MKKFLLIPALLVFHGVIALLQAQGPQLINYQGRVAVSGTNFDGQGQFKYAMVDGGTNTPPQVRTATATATVIGNFVVSYTVTDGGAGYTSAPSVTITGNGSGATATATVSGGAVTVITPGNAGSGYTGTATVTVGAPPAPTSPTTYVSYWSHDATSNAGSEPTGHVTLPVTKGLYSVMLGDTTILGMGTIPNTILTNPDVRLRIWFNDGSHGFQLMTPDQRIAAVGYAVTAGSATTAGMATTAGFATTAGSATTAANVPKIGSFSDMPMNNYNNYTISYTASTDGFLVASYSGSTAILKVQITQSNGATKTFYQTTAGRYANLTVPIRATGVRL